MSVCIIFTADLHGCLRPFHTQLLQQWKREKKALLLDGGDALGAPNLFVWPWKDRTAEWMNAAGYDAMALGNREHALTCRFLRAKLGGFHFPIVCTNLLWRASARCEVPLQRWLVLKAAGGLRIGVFALSEPILRPGSFWERISPVRYVPPQAVVEEALEALTPQADILIALTHFGRRPEKELATQFPQLSLILAAHWHAPQPSLEYVGTVAISRTYMRAQGAVILTYEKGLWRQESFPWTAGGSM